MEDGGMTELHADNLSKRMCELGQQFDRCVESGDRTGLREAWRHLLHCTDTVIRESRGARIEADALAAELSLYRPTRLEKPVAPEIPGHVYVFTARAWVCAAVELHVKVQIAAVHGGGYLQDHYVPEKKTLCGKATTYPVTERFTSGGWPRLHELCPECVRKLVETKKMNATA